jgi:dihydrofolate reductase
MGKVVVRMSLTLDGVMQAPGRADEDTRGGFSHGGWAIPYFHPMMAKAAGEAMASATPPALLFGRRTYEDFYRVWPGRTDNPFSKVLDAQHKYVVSTTLEEPLPWQNSTLLRGDAAEAVAALKAEDERDLVVMGSGVLIQTLMRHDLVDEWRLLVHPLVLGSGRRLFSDDGPPANLALAECQATPTGVIMATWRPTV